MHVNHLDKSIKIAAISVGGAWLAGIAAATYFGNIAWGFAIFIGIPLAVGGFVFYAASKMVRGPQG